MVQVIFSHDWHDKEKDELIKAGQEYDYTIKRADEVVEAIQAQADDYPGYEEFEYTRPDKEEE